MATTPNIARNAAGWLVVGAGFTGASAARRLAETTGEKILVIDRRDHVGGNEIADLPHDRVRDPLSGVTIYADFGHHPGRDRMPREAALCGACVLTNRRGSARYEEDVPLPRLYKLDHLDPGFAKNVARTIGLISATRPLHMWRQQRYRRFAASGREIFMREVRSTFFEAASDPA